MNAWKCIDHDKQCPDGSVYLLNGNGMSEISWWAYLWMDTVESSRYRAIAIRGENILGSTEITSVLRICTNLPIGIHIMHIYIYI